MEPGGKVGSPTLLALCPGSWIPVGESCLGLCPAPGSSGAFRAGSEAPKVILPLGPEDSPLQGMPGSGLRVGPAAPLPGLARFLQTQTSFVPLGVYSL